METSGLLTLLTDFGLSDPFVGLLHGVILRRFAGARIVDLCHGVAPQDVREGAFFLQRCYRYFPAGTVHVAVIDPGVGTDRAPLALAADGHLFVGPDNGSLGGIAALPGAVAHRIDAVRLGLKEPSRTFHGRDVFAPVAAELAAGRIRVSDVGPPLSPLRLPSEGVSRQAGSVCGSVVSVDRFGNLVTDIEAEEVRKFERPVIEIAGVELPLAGTYGEVPKGELLGLVGSFDTVEVALRDGDAAQQLGVGRSARAVLREAEPRQR